MGGGGKITLITIIMFQKKMKIEEVKSTIKTQRISAHTHVKGRYLYVVV